MSFVSRIVLSVPFFLALIDALRFGAALWGDDTIAIFWANHGFREVLYVVVLSALVLTFIWSAGARSRLSLIAILGAPIAFGFWVAILLTGAGSDFTDTDTLLHTAAAISFPIGLLMAVSGK